MRVPAKSDFCGIATSFFLGHEKKRPRATRSTRRVVCDIFNLLFIFVSVPRTLSASSVARPERSLSVTDHISVYTVVRPLRAYPIRLYFCFTNIVHCSPKPGILLTESPAVKPSNTAVLSSRGQTYKTKPMFHVKTQKKCLVRVF